MYKDYFPRNNRGSSVTKTSNREDGCCRRSRKVDYLDDNVLGVAVELFNELSFVCKTLGPGGANVLIDIGYNKNVFTKDGVSIIRAVNVSDPIKRMFLDKIKEVCNKTNNSGGDGTTTAFTILRSIVLNSYKYIKAGYHPRDIIRGIERVYKVADDYLSNNLVFKCTLDDLRNVANIATNDTHLGEIIHSAVCEMYEKFGGLGFIAVENSKSTKTYFVFSNGLTVDGGYQSHYFITDQATQSAYLDDPVVVIIKGILNEQELVVKILEYLHYHNKHGLIVCDDLDKASMHTLILNQMKGVVNKVVAVKYNDPDILEDLAVMVGARVIDKEFGNTKDVDISAFCGFCSSAKATKSSTEVIAGRGDPKKISERADMLRRMGMNSDGVINQTGNRFDERAKQLERGYAVIKVGGSTDSEIKQKQDRVIDGVSAVVVAERDGACIGGGITFLKIARMIRESMHLDTMSEIDRVGVLIFLEALQASIRQILCNVDASVDVVMQELYTKQQVDPDIGFDARDSQIRNLKESGVLDSKSAVADTLRYAVSIGCLIVTSVAVVPTQVNED